MNTNLLGGSGANDVSPELLAFLLRPLIGALINRDDELGAAPRIWRSLASVAFIVIISEQATDSRDSEKGFQSC